jgi:RNA polymerase sigma factor (sigma-70 family)
MLSGEPDDGTVTRWIGDLRSGGDVAAEQIWRRYFERLVRLTRKRLMSSPRAVADEEDVVLSAFHSFLAGVERGRFPDLRDRDDLWRLLVVITIRKAIDQYQHVKAVRRGGDQVLLDDEGLAGVLSEDPGPEMTALVADEYTRLREALGDDALRRVLDLRLEGYEREEIAARLGCSVRSVTRKLVLVREAWLKASEYDEP